MRQLDWRPGAAAQDHITPVLKDLCWLPVWLPICRKPIRTCVRVHVVTQEGDGPESLKAQVAEVGLFLRVLFYVAMKA